MCGATPQTGQIALPTQESGNLWIPQHARTGGRPSLLQLFMSFLRLGTTAFGGPAMVAYIRKMAVGTEPLAR